MPLPHSRARLAARARPRRIAIINGRPKQVRARLHEVFRRRHGVGVSAIALFELWYGVGKSAH